MSQCYVISDLMCTIELWMHLGGLLNTQEARVARGDSLTLISCSATSRVYLVVHTMAFIPFVLHLFVNGISTLTECAGTVPNQRKKAKS